jgi:N-acetylneuraminic acid mutarotase
VRIDNATRTYLSKLITLARKRLGPLARDVSGPRRALVALALTCALVAGVIILMPATKQTPKAQPYTLTAAAKSLIGPVDSTLANKITYDAKKSEYVFNQAGKGSANTRLPTPSPGTTNHSKEQAANPYSVDLPVDPSKGITYYDNGTQLSFTAVPEFPMNPAQHIDGRIVYGLPGGGEVIYSVNGNGLKEDIVFDNSVANQTFNYRLELPNTLQAKTVSGNGAIGIYSADPSLFGHISFGSSQDQLQVMQARQNSPKTNLVFGFPAPLIKQTDQKSDNGTGNVRFDLRNNELTVYAEGMTNLGYPVSVDPSVVVNTTAGFATGNNEGNIDFPANQINRGGLTGGTLGSWATTTTLSPAVYSETSVAYNGYIYVIGGCTVSSNCSTVTATVAYASINSNGTLASWATTTSLPTATFHATSVAFNGYVYEIGGRDAAGTYFATVDYALICTGSNNGIGGCGATAGTIGTWTATTSLPAVMAYANSAVYKNYVYEIGGYTGSSVVATVDYAPLHADGTLGSWTATTSLPTATERGASVAYNGYLYELGGCICGAVVTTVDYAPINADGTLGSWTGTTSLPAANDNVTAVAYDGYVYEFGGYTGAAAVATVNYAPIYANGTVGPWIVTTSLPNATWGSASVAYGGYLYDLGGCAPSCPTTEVDYAQIQPAGYLGSPSTGTPNAWAATTNLPATNEVASSVAYNGYLYEIGGCPSGCVSSAVVDYAPINANGTIGSWTATTSLPTATKRATSVAFNGYLYEIGGFTTVTVAVVDYALICTGSNNGTGGCGATAGTVGTWIATTSLPNATYYPSAVAYNGYIYDVGGFTTAVTATVDYALICTGSNSGTGGCGATAGTVGTWTATTNMLAATQWATSVASNGYLYEAGGEIGTGSTAVVDYALICTGGNSGTGGCGATAGTVGTWTATTSLPTTTDYATAVVSDGYLYEIGGCTDSACTTVTAVVDYAPIHTDGTIGSWVATTSLPAATDRATSVVYNGYVYEIGGSTNGGGTAITTVDYALINNGGPGTAGAWTATTSLPTAVELATSVAYNGYVYELGGCNASSCTGYLATVDYAPINAGGTLGSWTATTSLPSATFYSDSVVYNGYIYELGGNNAVGPGITTTVDYALICTGSNSGTGGCGATAGTLGSWSATTSLPSALELAGSVAYNGNMYFIGGYDGSAYSAVVDYAPINANGTLGSWTATTSLPTAQGYYGNAVQYNGYVYMIGGCSSTCTGGNSVAVNFAPVNTNGTLGSWTATSSLPAALNQAKSLADDGYLYEIGGEVASAATVSTVDYAPINADGTVGSWRTTTSLPTPTRSHTSIVYNGFVYLIGGCPGASCSSYTTTVDYAPLNVMPRVGHYSTLVNLGVTNATLNTITYTGTLPGGLGNISYETAGSNGVFGASALASALTGSTGSPCASVGPIQYVWMFFTVDDSQVGGFADAIGTNNANVTSFTINYATSNGHPPPNLRMRGGSSFQNNTQQPLDTCGP